MSTPKKMRHEDVAYCLHVAHECGATESSRHLRGHIAALEAEVAALENRDATTREACELINSAAERLRQDGVTPVDADALKQAEARGFERAKKTAAAEAYEAALSAQRAGLFDVADALHNRGDHIRAMKDETP